MKGLSLTQPWATLVAIGAKRIETRSWPTGYTGPIAIHASKAFPIDCIELLGTEPFRSVLTAAGYCADSRPNHRHPNQLLMAGEGRGLPLGAIVAVGELVTHLRFKGSTERWVRDSSAAGLLPEHELEFGDFSVGRLGFLLAGIRALPEPIPCRGALGLWTVPPDVLAQIERVHTAA